MFNEKHPTRTTSVTFAYAPTGFINTLYSLHSKHRSPQRNAAGSVKGNRGAQQCDDPLTNRLRQNTALLLPPDRQGSSFKAF